MVFHEVGYVIPNHLVIIFHEPPCDRWFQANHLVTKFLSQGGSSEPPRDMEEEAVAEETATAEAENSDVQSVATIKKIRR